MKYTLIDKLFAYYDRKNIIRTAAMNAIIEQQATEMVYGQRVQRGKAAIKKLNAFRRKVNGNYLVK